VDVVFKLSYLDVNLSNMTLNDHIYRYSHHYQMPCDNIIEQITLFIRPRGWPISYLPGEEAGLPKLTYSIKPAIVPIAFVLKFCTKCLETRLSLLVLLRLQYFLNSLFV
jgi:hypothetical protein